MAKLYIKTIVNDNKMKPKKETISFLLNYSKALTFIGTKSMNIETILN
jgi:hypothetical protein